MSFVNSEDQLERQQKLFREIFDQENKHWESFNFYPEGIDVDLLLQELKEIKASKFAMPVFFQPRIPFNEIRDYLSNPEYRREYNRKCMEPWRKFKVMPDGSVAPCMRFEMGNLLDHSFPP